MATDKTNGKGPSGSARNGGPTITDILDEADQGDGTQAAQQQHADIPVDDGADDERSQLPKLTLPMMGCRPEMSMAQDQMVRIDGQQQKIKAGKEIHQATIFGEITGLTGPKELPNAKSDADKYTYGLEGRIEGVNILTGEMFKASILYLPAGFHGMFLAEMEASLRGIDTNTTIVFALEFWSIPADNPRGYSWKAKNRMPMEKHDPLARLRARAMAGTVIKALPAPKDQPKQIAAS